MNEGLVDDGKGEGKIIDSNLLISIGRNRCSRRKSRKGFFFFFLLVFGRRIGRKKKRKRSLIHSVLLNRIGRKV